MWSHIVLKRGVDESLDVWKWRQTVIQEGPDNARVDGNIALIDYSGNDDRDLEVRPGLAGQVHRLGADDRLRERGGSRSTSATRAWSACDGAVAPPTLRTEYAFTLPRGYVDASGTVHREGIMRLATARDEIEPLRDPAVRENDAYLTVSCSRASITRIGDQTAITPAVVENLYAADFDHLQRLYERINSDGEPVGRVDCPLVRREFEVDLSQIEDVASGE